MKRPVAILAVVCALVAATFCSAQSVTVPVVTIDFATQLAVQATVEFKGPESRSVETGKDGRASVSLLPGKYQETITAPGYKTVTFSTAVHPNASDNGTEGAVLEPVKEPEEIAAANAQSRPGYTVVFGYAIDDHNQPVADVHIRLQGKGVESTETTTNYKGFFVMELPSPPPGKPMNEAPRSPADYLPGTGNLTATKSGYRTQLYTNLPLMNGQPSGLFVKMQRGSGTVETDEEPAWMNGTGGTNVAPGAVVPPRSEIKSPTLEREKTPDERRDAPAVSLGSIIPPNTMIKVGYPCPYQTIACSPLPGSTCPCSKYPTGCKGPPICSQACTGTLPKMPLEQYVQQGLQTEWVNTWGPPNGPLDADEAGAVAYRTFGYYYIQHPSLNPPAYNIRSDTCNQSFDPTKPASGNAASAAIATAGIAMSDDGASAFLTSYRAVTNHAPGSGCLDGQTGDGADWPCMNDPIQTGNANSGGGQGMSQWGSWEWAEGLSYKGQGVLAPGWQCILDHYYNDNGNATGEGGSGTYRYSFIYGPGGDGSIAFPLTTADLGPFTIYSLSTDGSNAYPVIEGVAEPVSGGPSWSPDHTMLAYANEVGGSWNIYTVNTSSGQVTQITTGGPTSISAPSWSRSGNNLIAMAGFPNPVWCVRHILDKRKLSWPAESPYQRFSVG